MFSFSSIHNVIFVATGGSGVASLAQEERRDSHVELLSGLSNGSTTEGQAQFCNSLGPSSAVLRSLPAAVDFFRNCSNHHPQLRIQVLHTRSLECHACFTTLVTCKNKENNTFRLYRIKSTIQQENQPVACLLFSLKEEGTRILQVLFQELDW